MRTLILTLALVVPAAWAQDKPAAKEAAKPVAEAPKPAPAVVAEKPSAGKKSRRHEDARHCLQKTSNTEVIKCAEVYL